MFEDDLDLMYNASIEKKLDEVIQLYDICYSMLLIYDQKGNVVRWNDMAQKMLNYDDVLKQTNMASLLPSIYRIDEGTMVTDETSRNAIIKTMLNRRNLPCLPVTVKMASVDIDGVFFGVCAILDLTEWIGNKKESEFNKVELSNPLVDQLIRKTEILAKISHELKVPVNGIYGLTEELEEEIKGEEYQDSFRLMKECCVNMKKMIDRILEYETLSNGVVILYEEEVDLHRLLANVIALHKPLAEEKGLHLYTNISKKIPRILFSDHNKIAAILNNLLSNAIKFTQIGYISLSITCAKIQPHLMTLLIAVVDTGIGIDMKQQEAIFHPFKQGGSHINQMYGGTGLGLAIVQQLVTLMKGTIQVNSVKGEGSEFIVSIQVKLEQDENQKDLEHVTQEEHLEEMLQEMRTHFVMDVEKRHYERILKVKCYNTRENKDEIVHNIDRIKQCVKNQNWEETDACFVTLKHLIPRSQVEIYEKLLKIELSVRRKEINRTLLSLNDFENEFK